MCIFVAHFGFLNFDLGGNFDLGSNPNQITFVFLIRHVRSGGPLAPGALLARPPPEIYNKVAERLPKTTNTFA